MYRLLAGRFEQLRDQAQLSASEVAARLGISRITLKRYETLPLEDAQLNIVLALRALYAVPLRSVLEWEGSGVPFLDGAAGSLEGDAHEPLEALAAGDIEAVERWIRGLVQDEARGRTAVPT